MNITAIEIIPSPYIFVTYETKWRTLLKIQSILKRYGGVAIKLKNEKKNIYKIVKIILKGNVVSAEELFHQIWKDEYYSKSNNTITVHIRHLREKMEDSFENPKYIKTVWGCGYKIEK